MYEASFGLKRRPFAATPDASCFLSAGPIQAALDELVICVQQGQGIAVLTSPAGTGKTLLCERLRCELDDRYETVFLRHASFLTRRALLQTILCELNHQYHHPSEQELRLELFPAIRALQPKREALVLICDEAHQLTDSLLEELRILADFAEAGRPLVRLVLVGQLSLEEKLAQPGLEAFNQRIRAHINLSTFDHAGSLDYIDYRVTWAGGRTDEVFTPAALDLIARASDGVPRCINQLADHSLLLAFVAEQKPASEELVREALSDLRQLPLHWNEPSQPRSASEHSEHRVEQDVDDTELKKLPSAQVRDSSGYLADSKNTAAMYSFEPELGDDTEIINLPPTAFIPNSDATTKAVPASYPEADASNANSTDVNSIEVGSDDWRQTVELFSPRKDDNSLVEALSGLIPEATNAAIDEQTHSKLKRRIEFHTLLQDAYDVAGATPVYAAESSDSDRAQFSEPPNRFENHSNSVAVEHKTNGSHPTFISTSNLSGTITVNGFQEEVIVDRYATIDAGFEPPAVSVPDTMQLNEVRANQVIVNPFSLHAPVTSVECGLDETTDFPVDSTIAEPTVVRQELRESTDFETRSGSVENVAEEVFSLGESLRPGDSLSSPSESILKALRNEVDGVNKSIETEHTAEASNLIATWESIETPLPPPPPAVEARPFRYLFSSLRRKQQGLA